MPPPIEGCRSETSVTESFGDEGGKPSVFGSLAVIFSFLAQTGGRFWDVVVVGTHWLRVRDRVNTFYECVFECRGDDRTDGGRELTVNMSREPFSAAACQG